MRPEPCLPDRGVSVTAFWPYDVGPWTDHEAADEAAFDAAMLEDADAPGGPHG